MWRGGIQEVSIGIALAVLFWLFKNFVVWRNLRRKLRFISTIYPLQRDGLSKPRMHVRTSLDRVSGGYSPQTMRGYVHIGDVMSAQQINDYFDDLPAKVEFKLFNSISPEMINVVLIGLSSRTPVANEIGELLYSYGIRVRGQGQHAFFRDSNGNEYHCEEIPGIDDRGNPTNLVKKDFGIIVRMKLDDGTLVLALGGIHTHGTQAAAQISLNRDFINSVRRSGYKEFIQFLSVDGIVEGPESGIGIHNIQWKQLPLEPLKWYK